MKRTVGKLVWVSGGGTLALDGRRGAVDKVEAFLYEKHAIKQGEFASYCGFTVFGVGCLYWGVEYR